MKNYREEYLREKIYVEKYFKKEKLADWTYTET